MNARKAPRRPRTPIESQRERSTLAAKIEAESSKVRLVRSLIATVCDAMGIHENLDYHRVLCLAYNMLGKVSQPLEEQKTKR